MPAVRSACAERGTPSLRRPITRPTAVQRQPPLRLAGVQARRTGCCAAAICRARGDAVRFRLGAGAPCVAALVLLLRRAPFSCAFRPTACGRAAARRRCRASHCRANSLLGPCCSNHTGPPVSGEYSRPRGARVHAGSVDGPSGVRRDAMLQATPPTDFLCVPSNDSCLRVSPSARFSAPPRALRPACLRARVGRIGSACWTA